MAQKLRKKSWIKLIFFLSYRKMWREHWCYGETRVTNTISRQRNILDPTYRGESWYLSVDVLACFLIGAFSYYLVKRSLLLIIFCLYLLFPNPDRFTMLRFQIFPSRNGPGIRPFFVSGIRPDINISIRPDGRM